MHLNWAFITSFLNNRWHSDKLSGIARWWKNQQRRNFFKNPLLLAVCLFALAFMATEGNAQELPAKKKKLKEEILKDKRTEGLKRRNVPENALVNDTTKTRRVGRGQGILDDTTRLDYGPSTTEHFFVKNWFEMDTVQYATDTSLVNLQRYSFPARNGYTIYDLGNVSTPLNSFYYQFPEEIGKRIGLNGFDAYITPEDEFKYYDTRSPYSDWSYAQGGGGRAILDVNMSQNVTPEFNIGFRYFRLSSRFMLGQRPQQRNNLQGQRENFHLHTNFSTNNHRYRVMAHFSAVTHNLQESGGVNIDLLLNDTTGIYDLFLPENEGLVTNRLTQANSKTIRRSAYLYHQFALFDSSRLHLLQLFNEIDARTYQYRYVDENPQGNIDFYPLPFDSNLDNAFHQLRFEELDTRYGLKSKWKGIFVAGWFRNRQYAQSTEYQVESISREEVPNTFFPLTLEPDQFVGVEGNYKIGSDSSKFPIKASLYFENQLNGEGRLLKASLESNYLSASFQQGNYAPTQMQTYYLGDFFQWRNQDFQFEQAQRVRIAGQFPLNKGAVSVSVNQTTLNNHIFFDTLALPTQAENTLSYRSAELNVDYKTWYIRHIAQVIYTQTEDDEVFRIPEILANYQVFFEKDVFQGATFVQLGFDFHWNSPILAYGYMPVTQQFHVQNDYESGDYVLADFFINLSINRVRAFVKITNALQGAFGKRGYYMAPYYMAQPRDFEFGVRWLLFD